MKNLNVKVFPCPLASPLPSRGHCASALCVNQHSPRAGIPDHHKDEFPSCKPCNSLEVTVLTEHLADVSNCITSILLILQDSCFSLTDLGLSL